MTIRVTWTDSQVLRSVLVELGFGLSPRYLPQSLAGRLEEARQLLDRIRQWQRLHGRGADGEIDLTLAEFDLLIEATRAVVAIRDTEFQTVTGHEPEEALETLARLEAQRGGAGSP